MISFENKQVVFKRHHDGHTWLDGDAYYTITMNQKRGSQEGEYGDEILLYRSEDAVHWTELGVIFRRKKNKHPDACQLDAEGFAEFPYRVPFEDTEVLMVGGLPVHYWTGRLDRHAPAFLMDSPEPRLLDYTSAFHCFNPSIVDHKGENAAPRRVILAMMEAARGRANDLPWYGAHTIPRALELAGDHLCQYPVEELKTLRADHFCLSDIALSASFDVPKEGDAVEIMADFEMGDAQEVGLKVLMSADGGTFIRIFYNAERNEFGADGNFYKNFRASANHAIGLGQGPAYVTPGERVRIRVFIDKCLAEAFLNGQSCSMVVQDLAAAGTKIGLFSTGGTAICRELHIWDMKAI
jgi:sucrose-6-phosphate hydrolase SacC (GH32 family)